MKIEKMDIEFEKSSGNVFADLDVEDAEELQARAMIGYHVIQLLKDKNMKQKELAEILGVKQAEISHLLNGHFSRFTTDKLLDFLKRMNLKVTIQISHHKSGEPYQNVFFDDNQKQCA
jgi:predicted XRE-type DNA-binding protein